MNSVNFRSCIGFLVILMAFSFSTPKYTDSVPIDSHSALDGQLEAFYSPNNSFFPLGIYGAFNSTEIWASWNNWFNTAAFGFDEPISFKSDIEEALMVCDVLGMKVLFDLSYFLRYSALDELLDLFLTVADHPSIYAWYIVDEPGISFVGGANGSHIDGNMIRDAFEIIRRIDTTRPTFVQFSLASLNESFLDGFAEVPNFVDIIAVDPYPIMPHTNHSIVADWVDTIQQFNAGRAKVWVVLTGQRFPQSQDPGNNDFPTEAEYMIDSMLALQRGAEGLLWFAYEQFQSGNFMETVVPNSWTALGRVVRRISQITHIIIDRENEMKPVRLSATLEAAYAKRGQQIALFLANHDYFWNGTDTEWRLRNETIMFEAPNVISVSRVEPNGPVPLSFKVSGDSILLDISVEGGIILLIESSSPITLSELRDTGIWYHASLFFVSTVILHSVWKRKRGNFLVI